MDLALYQDAAFEGYRGILEGATVSISSRVLFALKSVVHVACAQTQRIVLL
jgi:hypothetical protein